MYVFLAVAALSLVASGMLWQKLSNIQEQLARQSADAGSNAIEARALARQAQELARETAARQALTETRLSEVALQRSQVEELMQSLSRSRDENLVVDIESALRLAQQQAQLTGSVEPLLAALRSADQRLERSGQPRLSRVRAAIARDIDRIKCRQRAPTCPACWSGWTSWRGRSTNCRWPMRCPVPVSWRAPASRRRRRRFAGGSVPWPTSARRPAAWCA